MPGITNGSSIGSSAQINAGVIDNSDIADDIIETGKIKNETILSADIKDGEIVNADISASAGIVDTKLATISTAGKVSGAALTSLSSIPAGAGIIPAANLPGGSDTVITPLPLLWFSGVSTGSNNNNTFARGYLTKLVKGITLNKISFRVTAVGTAGVLKIGIYSEDGQTQYLDLNTASISTTGEKTTAVSSVVLPAGNYWFFLLPVGTAAITVSTFAPMTTVVDMNDITSEISLAGDYSCAASTLPATMTISSISANENNMTVFRLDN
jgi:hypothetical protein